MEDRSHALQMAFLATSELYKPKIVLGTNLWCISKVNLVSPPGGGEPRYIPVNRKRATEIYPALKTYVESLPARSVARWIESDYLEKYYTFRNYYLPESLRQQAEICSWFLGGRKVLKPVSTRMAQWWERYVPKNYRVRRPVDIACPRYEAAAGVVMTLGDSGSFEWDYLKKGPAWDRIQLGTIRWLDLVERAVPDGAIDLPINSILGQDWIELENLAVETPVIRSESGPGKVRWARNSSGNVYILGRMFAEGIQNGESWSNSPAYIGKASNTIRLACKAAKADTWLVGTHGDDWIAWCPECQMWHSGDWSNFDLHISARTILANRTQMLNVIRPFLSRQELKWFYALTYLAIRCPTIWLWGRGEKPSLSIRRTLGKTRSGSGEFILDNNCENAAVTRTLLEMTHAELKAKGRRYPCKSRMFWPEFARLALYHFGWVAKPTSQLSHPMGFVACRCIHDVSRGYLPSPCITSVVRNWVNPAYNPEEFPLNTVSWMRTRFRDVVKTLAWSPDAETPFFQVGGERLALGEGLAEVAMNAGVEDPWGVDQTQGDISRDIGRVKSQYGTDAYLSS